MSTFNWTKQDPELVQGLVAQSDTELQNFWLQVYDCGSFYQACIYGISTNCVFELMGREYCKTEAEAKANAEQQWQDFRQNSRLYSKAKLRSEICTTVRGAK